MSDAVGGRCIGCQIGRTSPWSCFTGQGVAESCFVRNAMKRVSSVPSLICIRLRAFVILCLQFHCTEKVVQLRSSTASRYRAYLVNSMRFSI